MRHKFHKIWLSLLLASSASASETVYPSGFENEALGKCFVSTDVFVQSALGDDSLNDPNIKRTQKEKWIWVVDQTSSKNYTWYLLDKKNTEVCLRAYVPVANTVRFRTKAGISTIEAFISPEVDLPGKLIEFVPDTNAASYHPKNCYLLEKSINKKILRKKLISCNEVLN